MYTRAMPDHSSLFVIQLTDVPVNVNVARDPAVIDSLALLPLLKVPLFMFHDPFQVIAVLVCSTRFCELPGVDDVEPPVVVPVEPPEVEPVEVEPVEVEPVEVEPVELDPVEFVPETTSKASTQTHALLEDEPLRPVAVMVSV